MSAHDVGVDAAGTRHARWEDRPTLRIVSLVPSLTELLCDLGLADAVVGRTGYCIHPAETVASIAKVGGTKQVNVDKIRRLSPTHLVVNVDENEKPTVDALAAFVPNVIVTHPQKPDDNPVLYRLFAHAFAREAAGERLCKRFDDARTLLDAARAAARWPMRRVLYLIWKDPWMTVGRDTYIAEMLAAIGWEQADAIDARDRTVPSSDRYPAIDLARAAAKVELVLLSSEPYHFTAEHAAQLADLGPAVRLVDGELLSWYGSRAIAGLHYLATLASQDD